MKLNVEQWKKVMEADNEPIDEKAIEEFLQRVKKFKESHEIITKEITDV